MKRTLTLLLVVSFGAWLGYIASQQPNVWCDQQWAGISLTKGGYRSWSLRFCDGFYMLTNDAGFGRFGGSTDDSDGSQIIFYTKEYRVYRETVLGFKEGTNTVVLFTNHNFITRFEI